MRTCLKNQMAKQCKLIKSFLSGHQYFVHTASGLYLNSKCLSIFFFPSSKTSARDWLNNYLSDTSCWGPAVIQLYDLGHFDTGTQYTPATITPSSSLAPSPRQQKYRYISISQGSNDHVRDSFKLLLDHFSAKRKSGDVAVRTGESRSIGSDSGFAFPLDMLLWRICIIPSSETEFYDRIIGKVKCSSVHGRSPCG